MPSNELGRVACVAHSKRLEVKKVRPVKTMWPSLIPASYRNAAERTTRAARPAPGYISTDKPLDCPACDSSVTVSQARRLPRDCLCDYSLFSFCFGCTAYVLRSVFIYCILQHLFSIRKIQWCTSSQKLRLILM